MHLTIVSSAHIPYLCISEGLQHALEGKNLNRKALLVGSQVLITAGQPCGGLGYESLCWVGFDSQFDMIRNLCKCRE
jgi:hypothetical protein